MRDACLFPSTSDVRTGQQSTIAITAKAREVPGTTPRNYPVCFSDPRTCCRVGSTNSNCYPYTPRSRLPMRDFAGAVSCFCSMADFNPRR